MIIWIVQGSKATSRVNLFNDSRKTGVKLADAENLQMNVKPRKRGSIQSL